MAFTPGAPPASGPGNGPHSDKLEVLPRVHRCPRPAGFRGPGVGGDRGGGGVGSVPPVPEEEEPPDLIGGDPMFWKPRRPPGRNGLDEGLHRPGVGEAPLHLGPGRTGSAPPAEGERGRMTTATKTSSVRLLPHLELGGRHAPPQQPPPPGDPFRGGGDGQVVHQSSCCATRRPKTGWPRSPAPGTPPPRWRRSPPTARRAQEGAGTPEDQVAASWTRPGVDPRSEPSDTLGWRSVPWREAVISAPPRWSGAGWRPRCPAEG